MEITKSTSVPYKCKQTLAKAVKKVERSLPNELNKKLKVLDVLTKKYKNMVENNEESQPSNLLESCEEAVVNFYTSDDVSVQAAGKKDTILDDGMVVAKRFMLMTIDEAYQLFKNDFPNEVVSRTRFFKLRPSYVQLTSKMPHNMCVCTYHANFGFLLEGCSTLTPSIPKNFESFLQLVCCDIKNENCMTSNCENCVKDIKSEIVPIIHLMRMDEKIKWQHWKKVDNRLSLTYTIGSYSELFDELETQLPAFKLHSFHKRSQQKYLNETKENLMPGELVLQVDFAENYRLILQNEVQSAHFSYKQVTIFTCVAWIFGETKSFAVVSDKLSHSKDDVICFLTTLVKQIQNRFGEFSKIFLFSDGSSSQFKNKFIISYMPDFLSQFGCSYIEWNFFATSHGKGAVDGVGAVLKRKVWQITKSKSIVLSDAISFFECAQQNVHGIEICYISSEQVEDFSLQFISKRKEVKRILGIRKLHSFSYDGDKIKAARTAYSQKKIL